MQQNESAIIMNILRMLLKCNEKISMGGPEPVGLF